MTNLEIQEKFLPLVLSGKSFLTGCGPIFEMRGVKCLFLHFAQCLNAGRFESVALDQLNIRRCSQRSSLQHAINAGYIKLNNDALEVAVGTTFDQYHIEYKYRDWPQHPKQEPRIYKNGDNKGDFIGIYSEGTLVKSYLHASLVTKPLDDIDGPQAPIYNPAKNSTTDFLVELITEITPSEFNVGQTLSTDISFEQED